MSTKTILAFTGGAATGVLLCTVIFKDEFQKRLDEELEAMEEYYKGKHELDEDLEDELTEDDEYVNYVRKYDTPNELVEKKGYISELEKHADIQSQEDELKDIIEEVIEVGSEKYNNPYVIDLEDFETSNLEHDKITLNYYSADNTLADEDEEIIPDIKPVIGDNSLFQFGDMSGDPNVVHVRNNRLGADYEVCLTEESYAEVVLGLTEGNDI